MSKHTPCPPETEHISITEGHISEIASGEVADGNKANESFIVRQRRLTELVEELSSPDRPDVLPLIVGVSDLEADTVSLHVPDEAPNDVVEALFGFVAPQEWDALIVVAHGVAYSESEKGDNITIGYGVGRKGEEVSVLRRDADVMVSSLPAEGRVLDCCHRAFALSTPPAQENIVELFISSWLCRIFRATGGDGTTDGEAGAEEVRKSDDLESEILGWPLLVKLHPLIEEEGGYLSPIDVGIQTRELCQKGSWGRLRRAVETGDMSHSSITSEQAGWMDDSMFARWCLAAFPDSDELADRLYELLPAELYQMVMECLEEQRS